ncbi:NUDIX hydrolase [Candidatus Nomurabacteria bacterium]|nr:NUDIX hydrolase [Candidatus Kaiserbacteria bacterium]MCB9814895.1 NUDIX hydrolase [Candidatus Nomurabacteria bacterium]
MKLKKYLYAAIMPFRRWYWNIFKPKTFGVKILIMHSQNQNEILLVRPTYGNQTLWNIPGGGYNPKKETALVAALRETKEEIGVDVSGAKQVGEYQTSGEGKHDTVTLFAGKAITADLVLNSEIAEVVWQDYKIALNRSDVARVARRTIEVTFSNKYS